MKNLRDAERKHVWGNGSTLTELKMTTSFNHGGHFCQSATILAETDLTSLGYTGLHYF
jgi:hypothetical protein